MVRKDRRRQRVTKASFEVTRAKQLASRKKSACQQQNDSSSVPQQQRDLPLEQQLVQTDWEVQAVPVRDLDLWNAADSEPDRELASSYASDDISSRSQSTSASVNCPFRVVRPASEVE